MIKMNIIIWNNLYNRYFIQYSLIDLSGNNNYLKPAAKYEISITNWGSGEGGDVSGNIHSHKMTFMRCLFMMYIWWADDGGVSEG